MLDVELRDGDRDGDKEAVPLQEVYSAIPSAWQDEGQGQRSGKLLPARGQKYPFGHKVQVELEVAPVALLKVPAGQAIALMEKGGQ